MAPPVCYSENGHRRSHPFIQGVHFDLGSLRGQTMVTRTDHGLLRKTPSFLDKYGFSMVRSTWSRCDVFVRVRSQGVPSCELTVRLWHLEGLDMFG